MKNLQFYLCVLAGSISCQSTNDSKLDTFYDDLFKGYKKSLFPNWKSITPLDISFQLIPGGVIAVKEIEESITLTMTISMEWKDPRLSWNSSIYGYLYHMQIESDEIWKPYVYLANSVEGIKEFGADSKFYASLLADGTVYFSPGTVLIATCQPDISHFPFDTQSCRLYFYMWGILKQSVNMKVISEKPTMDYFYNNSDWTVVKVKQSLFETEQFQQLVFDISIKRQPLYHIITVILPTLMFSLLNPLVFALPVESGERVGLSMTILLSYAIFLTLVASSIPAASNPICVLILLLVVIMMISGIIVTMVIASSYFYHQGDISGPNACLRCLGIICQRNTTKTLDPDVPDICIVSGKDVSKALDTIFIVMSYLLFIVLLTAYFLYVLI